MLSEAIRLRAPITKCPCACSTHKEVSRGMHHRHGQTMMLYKGEAERATRQCQPLRQTRPSAPGAHSFAPAPFLGSPCRSPAEQQTPGGDRTHPDSETSRKRMSILEEPVSK